jgi:3'-phosphoadenosine 5'-phosphosulfate (PAPS) 3'-phosphatase
MTEEEMQQKMEFIIEQQAQFTVNIDLLRENINRLSEAQQLTETRVAEVATAQAQAARAQAHMNEVVTVMAESQQRTDQKLAETDERLNTKLAETDERLNTLINVVERYISEGRNGKPQG